MRIIELSGPPAACGREHGRLLGGEIRRLRRALLAYLARLSCYAGGLPLWGLLLALARNFWPYIPPRFREEIAGVAAGAEIGLGTVLLINVLDDLGNNSPRCSALAVGDRRTKTGAWLMGRNLDYPLFTEVMVELETLFLRQGPRGQDVASLGWPGYVGVCTGLNRAGVALAQLSSMSRDHTLRGTPAALRFRQALEAGKTVPEVAARVLKSSGTIGNNLLLCSATEAVVLEVSAHREAVRHPEAGLITATNHYQAGSMSSVKGKFPPRPPFSPLSPYHFSEAYSRARNERLQLLAPEEGMGPQEIQAMLADPRIANPGTVGSHVFSPGDLTLWVARGAKAPVNRGPFEKIKLWS